MRQFLLLSLLSLSTLLIGCAAQKAQKWVETPKHRVEDIRKTRVFTADDGVEVIVVDLANKKALIKVTGSESPVEGLVRAHDLEPKRNRKVYRTKHDGRIWSTIVFARRYGSLRITLFIPGLDVRSGLSLTLDEKKKVDVAALLALHREQAASGKLAELRRFNQAKARKRYEDELKKEAARTKKVCGFAPETIIEWQTIGDQILTKYSVSGFCADHLLSAMRYFCGKAPVAKKLFARFKTIRCRQTNKEGFEFKPNEIVNNVGFKMVNLLDLAKKALSKLKVDNTTTLEEAIAASRTNVCKAKGKDKYVIIAPRESAHEGVSYGDGKRFFRNKPNRYIGNNWFFDPRQFNPRHNRRMRGVDLRSYSYIKADRKTGKCVLTCGTRNVPLEFLGEKEKMKILAAAKYEPGPHQRAPYAMARDRKGTYFYVDRGTTPETRKDYRVYVGPRGRMKRQKMKDIVSDSEGDIFSTRRGKLRLVLGKEQALWIGKRRPKKLLWVPIRTNLKMIYNELGVYLGQRLGVPCDDL